MLGYKGLENEKQDDSLSRIVKQKQKLSRKFNFNVFKNNMNILPYMGR